MNTVDDNTLMAYLDGELDQATAREVERSVASDPALDAKVCELRQGDALLRSAFNHVMFDAGPATALTTQPRREQVGHTHLARWWGPLPAAIAASLAILLIGAVTGFTMLDSVVQRELERRSLAKERDLQVMKETLSSTLETQISGTQVSWRNPDSGNHGTAMPIQTWRTKGGQYCREFQESTTVNGNVNIEHGIACRTHEGLWKVRMRYFPE